MHAKQIMTTTVITVGPETGVRDLAALLLENRISAVPVVSEDGELVGIVSEGDLTRRAEIGTARQRSWWLALLTDDGLIGDYVKSHGQMAKDVMTRDVVTVSPDSELSEIVATLEKNQIKRVPVMEDGKLVGIVSRANLLHGLAAYRPVVGPKLNPSDNEIREALLASFREAGIHAHLLNLVVRDREVSLFGVLRSEMEKSAVRVAAENLDGIRAIHDDTVVVADPILAGY